MTSKTTNPYYIFFNVTTDQELEQAIEEAFKLTYDTLQPDTLVVAA